MSFPAQVLVMTSLLTAFGGLDDRRLSLIAADGRLRDFDADLVGDLQLHALLAEPRDLAVDAAGRDHPIADLEAVEKLPAPSAASASSAAG